MAKSKHEKHLDMAKKHKEKIEKLKEQIAHHKEQYRNHRIAARMAKKELKENAA